MSLSLYAIDEQIAALENAVEDGMMIDPETGELLSVEEALDALNMAREQKIEGVACWCKNLIAEAKAIEAEENALYKRRKAAENKAARLRSYLLNALLRPDGTAERVVTARCSVSIRKNRESVVCDQDILPDGYKKTRTTIEPDKALLYELLKSGEIIPGAHLEQSRSVMIK